jgi:predicted DNA-binding helix-hairpin-helix protein
MGRMKERIDEARAERRGPRFSPAGQSTQMIVGADATDDAGVLRMSDALYRGYGLRRVYYSAFSPIPDSSRILPAKAPPLQRENRLYQADWLLRFYGFTVEEIAAGTEDGMLDLAVDPKLAWALKHRDRFPVDVNRAEREMLLRVPGLGAKAVDKIVAARRHATLTFADVARLSSGARRAEPFLVTADHRPVRLADRADLKARLLRPAAQQLSLF